MKILYIDQYFSTREGISGDRTYEFARILVRRGHRVTVITSDSEYAGRERKQKRRFAWRTQSVDGIRVLILPVGYSSRMGYLRRAAAFATFMILGTVAALFSEKHDVVYATSTPLTVGIPGFCASRLRGSRFVFEVRDLWPEAPIQLSVIRNAVLIRCLRGLEKFFYRKADLIVPLSEGMKRGVLDTGVQAAKCVTIPNACDTDLFTGIDTNEIRKSLDVGDRILCVYAGAVGPANDLRYLLDVAKKVEETEPDGWLFLVVGDGPQRSLLEAQASRSGSPVRFIGPFSRKKAAEYIAAADMTLTLFKDLEVLGTNSPNKLFDSLAAGKPVLVNSRGWTRDLVETERAGCFLPPDDPARAAHVLMELRASPDRIRQMGENAGRLARDVFDRAKLADRLEQALVSVAKGK